MKRLVLTVAAAIALGASPAHAQDVREASRKAEADRAAAIERAAAAERDILADRAALLAEVERLGAEEGTLEATLAALDKKVGVDEARREALAERWSREELATKEISGNIRLAARELEALLEQSPLTALRPERLESVRRVLKDGYYPDIDDVSGMAAALLEEMELSGQVALHDASFVTRSGEEKVGQVMTIGPFTTLYRDKHEVGFLTYSSADQKLVALSALAPRSMRSILDRYMRGKGQSVIVDISGGAALPQITHRVGFFEHMRLGGPVIIPIVAIAFAAAIIIVMRVLFLNKVHGNTDEVMREVSALAARGDWEGCQEVVRRPEYRGMPVINVIADGLSARGEDREALESVLQEAILREIPRVERGLSSLSIFAAVAPLLGLLGTVVGMIETFRVITLYGTGDPRLMSNGISEALITTEVGLVVCIPIMLIHTFLSRRANAIIGEMEEKAVYLTNVISKDKARDAQAVPREEADDVVAELAEEVAA